MLLGSEGRQDDFSAFNMREDEVWIAGRPSNIVHFINDEAARRSGCDTRRGGTMLNAGPHEGRAAIDEALHHPDRLQVILIGGQPTQGRAL
jgi:hypothetical protein